MAAETKNTPRIVTDAEQVAAIDAAVAEGWRITRVETLGSFATVHFAKEIAPPYPPEPIRYDGFETVTQEWGCGLVAGRHAQDIMEGQQL